MPRVANSIEITMLLDLYGEVLTNKQRDYLNFYYNDDLSLSEIAENEGITRQGVRDAIKRAEALLFDMESKLKFSRKLEKKRKICYDKQKEGGATNGLCAMSAHVRRSA